MHLLLVSTRVRRQVRHQSKLPLCTSCRELGYTPRNTRGYTCNWCCQRYGDKMFWRKDVVRHQRRGLESALHCRSCLEETLVCGRCSERFHESHWSLDKRKNHRYHNTPLVCKVCCSLGYRLATQQSITCHTCKKDFGPGMFSPQQSRNYRHRKRKTAPCVRHLRSRQANMC